MDGCQWTKQREEEVQSTGLHALRPLEYFRMFPSWQRCPVIKRRRAVTGIITSSGRNRCTRPCAVYGYKLVWRGVFFLFQHLNFSVTKKGQNTAITHPHTERTYSLIFSLSATRSWEEICGPESWQHGQIRCVFWRIWRPSPSQDMALLEDYLSAQRFLSQLSWLLAGLSAHLHLLVHGDILQ